METLPDPKPIAATMGLMPTESTAPTDASTAAKSTASSQALGPAYAAFSEQVDAVLPLLPQSLACKETPFWKRSLDLLMVAALSPVLMPIMLLIACHIKCVSQGPIFFCQRRLGYGGRHFTILKFRTLKPEAYCVTRNHRAYVADLIDSDQPAAKPDISQRLIRGGRFLRDTSLDELPQLFNVLYGDMSIVGPRPDVLEWEDYKPWQRRRFEVAPGITGLWQVSGKNRLTFEEMIRLDIRYAETRSWQLDLWILWKTIAVVFRRGNK
jgi:lipopolysaccharide/colanic/teichoic acid biosynthesis glycosyltransferase